MAVSQYDKENLSTSQQAQIAAVTKAAESKSMSWDDAHMAAEAIRNSAGYSGGRYGDEYNQAYKAADLPSYQAQTDAVNSVYDRAQKNILNSLESSYQASKAEAEQAREKIPAVYQSQANSVEATAEKNKQAFNEAAAASGINSGAGSQAQLAQNTAAQGNFSTVRTAEANAINDSETQLNQLYANYQSSISEAISNNEYERAAALLSEYQKAQDSIVSVAQAQADENYRSYSSGVTASQTSDQDALSKAETLAAYGDFSGYSALGYSSSEISNMASAWNTANPDLAYNTGRITASEYKTITGKYPTGVTGTTETATASDVTGSSSGNATSSGSSYDNGSLSSSQVKTLQNYYGVSEDGLWGSNSAKAAGGLSADAAWAAYQGKNGSGSPTISDYAQLGSSAKQLLSNMERNSARVGTTVLSDGNLAKIASAIQKGTITEVEANYILDQLGVKG